MNHQGKRIGFTLIELLVVLGIIAILAAILVPAASKGLTSAKKARARTEIQSIKAAIKAYYNEYGKWPCAANGSADVTYVGAGGAPNAANAQAQVIKILRAINTTNNPRNIIFLEVNENSMKDKADDTGTYQVANSFFLDPWGVPYYITMDTDFDNQCDIAGAGALSPATIQGQTVCVWSGGPDPSDADSIIKSWQ